MNGDRVRALGGDSLVRVGRRCGDELRGLVAGVGRKWMLLHLVWDLDPAGLVAVRLSDIRRAEADHSGDDVAVRSLRSRGLLPRPVTDVRLDRTFYTGRPLRPTDAHVDHFLPWARSPIDAIENLVVADHRVNLNKSDHLASAEHVEAWRQRNLTLKDDLAAVAATNRWESAPASALGVARALYTSLHPRTLLWAGRDDFVHADLPRLRQALAA